MRTRDFNLVLAGGRETNERHLSLKRPIHRDAHALIDAAEDALPRGDRDSSKRA